VVDLRGLAAPGAVRLHLADGVPLLRPDEQVFRAMLDGWRNQQLARNRIYTATELVPLLHDRGIDLSASQVHRLVSGAPERLSLQVLSALCDILECTPADLVATTAENAGVRKTATGDVPAPSAAVAKLRPRPARILDGE
jgi:DNA-binding Xre family transcriptional regulator